MITHELVSIIGRNSCTVAVAFINNSIDIARKASMC